MPAVLPAGGLFTARGNILFVPLSAGRAAFRCPRRMINGKYHLINLSMSRKMQTGIASLALVAVGVAVALATGTIYYYFIRPNNGISIFQSVSPKINLAKYQDQTGGVQYALLHGTCGSAGAIEETATAKLLIVDSKCVQAGENMLGWPVDECENVAVVIDGVCHQDAETIDDDGYILEITPCKNYIEECFKGSDCGVIENSDIKNLCFAYSKKDYSYCGQIGRDKFRKEECYQYFIDSAKAPTLEFCKKLSQTEKDSFIGREIGNSCVRKLLPSLKSKEECAEIANFIPYGAECYYNIAVASNDPLLCGAIRGMKVYGEISEAACYEAIAQSKASLLACARLFQIAPQSDIATECLESFFIGNDYNICRQELSGDDADLCLFGYAQFKKDIDICGMVVKDSYREKCYMNIALRRTEPDICGKINVDRQLRVDCYESLFFLTGDKTICKKDPSLDYCESAKITINPFSDGSKMVRISYQKNGKQISRRNTVYYDENGWITKATLLNDFFDNANETETSPASNLNGFFFNGLLDSFDGGAVN